MQPSPDNSTFVKIYYFLMSPTFHRDTIRAIYNSDAHNTNIFLMEWKNCLSSVSSAAGDELNEECSRGQPSCCQFCNDNSLFIALVFFVLKEHF